MATLMLLLNTMMKLKFIALKYPFSTRGSYVRSPLAIKDISSRSAVRRISSAERVQNKYV